MFLFKCCSNHSLPNFLKSTKGRQPSAKHPVAISPQSLHVRCSNEVVKNVSVEVLDVSTDSDFPDVIYHKDALLADDSAHKHNSFCTSQLGQPTERNLEGKYQLGVQSSLSNCVVVLVGENSVKTTLTKNGSSLPSFLDSTVDGESLTTERSPIDREKCLQNKLRWEKCAVSKPRFSLDEDELFMFKSSEFLSTDRSEFVLKRRSEKRRIRVDNIQFQNATSSSTCQNMVVTVCQSSASAVEHDDAKLADNRDDTSHSFDSNTSTVADSDSLPQLPPSKFPEESQSEVPVKTILYSEICNFSDSLSIRAGHSPTFGSEGNVAEGIKSEESEILEPVEGTSASGAPQSSDPTETSHSCQSYDIPTMSKEKFGNIAGVILFQGFDDDPTFEERSSCTDGEVAAVTDWGKLWPEGPGQPIPDCKVTPAAEAPANSSVGLMFAGDSASYLEEFLPRESYSPPVRFTLVDSFMSPSTSDDSLKNHDDVTSSIDSLLSGKSPSEPPLRPCDFGESGITFASSPDDQPLDPGDFHSSRTHTDIGSVADSLLQSPESPSEGIDFRHFYSKSLPNLNDQPYNSVSSFGIIEEYFSRYIIEGASSEDEGLGSQVDPKPDASSHDDKSNNECNDDICRQHSLEKLTEICKRFSSSYLNFLQSSRSECELDTLPCGQHAKDDALSNPPADEKREHPVNRSDSTPALSALYAAIFPHSDNKTATSVTPEGPSTNQLMPPRKPSIVGRSLSLRETSESSPDGANKVSSAKKKKVVKFADSLGLELAIVRLILSGENLSDQDFQHRIQAAGVSCCSNNCNQQNSKTTTTSQTETRKIVTEFCQPGNSDDFLRRVKAQKVLLESCLPEENSRSVSGCVRVTNLTFEKYVVVRYTLNDWLSYNETPASYIFGSNDGQCDRFSFSIKLPSFFDVGSSLEFAIMYRTNDGKEYWDNNSGPNYRLVCHRC